MYILGIETSCDETALAIVRASGNLKTGPKFEVLREVVSSQIAIHRPFGGVVPNLAKREHLKNLPILLGQIFGKERIASSKGRNHKPYATSHTPSLGDVDAIAVTVGPGLEPALWAGITFAEELGKKYKKPVIGANHLEGHLYSFLLPQKTVSTKHPSFAKATKGTQIPNSKQTQNPKSKTLNLKKIFPAVALIVSGGHTVLLLLKNLKSWKRLGETRDDAVGEAFDKVARILKLPYPGGPEIQKLVEKLPKSWKDKINFPRPMMNDKNPVKAGAHGARYDFSFSGLKTSVLYYMRDISDPNNPNYIRIIRKDKKNSGHSDAFVGWDRVKAEVAGSFSNAATDVLAKKTMRAASDFNAQSILLSGGVAANKMLRERLSKKADENGLEFFVAEHKYNTDNAVMIAVAGYMNILRKKKYKMEADGMLNI